MNKASNYFMNTFNGIILAGLWLYLAFTAGMLITYCFRIINQIASIFLNGFDGSIMYSTEYFSDTANCELIYGFQRMIWCGEYNHHGLGIIILHLCTFTAYRYYMEAEIETLEIKFLVKPIAEFLLAMTLAYWLVAMIYDFDNWRHNQVLETIIQPGIGINHLLSAIGMSILIILIPPFIQVLKEVFNILKGIKLKDL